MQPEECMMIGDSLTADIAGGKLYGMSTCWYVPSMEKYNRRKIKKWKTGRVYYPRTERVKKYSVISKEEEKT